MHMHYEELCALTATGQINSRDRADLREHLESCDKCRAFIEDVGHVSNHGAPMLATSRAQRLDAKPPIGIRERFLERASAEGFKLTAGPVIARDPSVDPHAESANKIRAKRSVGRAWQGWLRIPGIEPLPATLSLVACVAFGILGYLLALERHSARPASPAIVASESVKADGSRDRTTRQADEEKTQLEQKVQMISAELAAAEGEKQEQSKKLTDLAQQAAVGAQLEHQFRQKTKDLQDAEDRIVKLKSELEVVQQKQSEAEAILTVQQQAAQDANAKLTSAELQLQKEREFQSARSEISDLISARNLHIVDVHDTEPGGKRQRAFGRVFYVEGESLVFYAYDLATPSHPDKKIIFHVWGETAGVKETTRSLGILHSDNPSEARWVLTFDDPKILNRINAVYITAERDSPRKHDPQGRKLLYAFLGSPNHP